MSVEIGKRDLFNLEFEPGDRPLLEAIAKDDSSRSLGATLRRLIREEARRRNINVSQVVSGQDTIAQIVAHYYVNFKT